MPSGGILPFSERLLSWFDRHGRKDLPWQHPRTPYQVWISEIMLQQTQVATVIPYFERWMQSFPDIQSLAEAAPDDLMAHWSGLGYYARARNIHKAAAICVAEHDGALPLTPEQLCGLPGIGLSTANAIISQATDRPAPVLDGNVRRVLARHTATPGWTGSTAVQKALWQEADKRLPGKRGADYTQAIMDLGALVCTRGQPGCADCPVNQDCQARLQDRTNELPAPRPTARIKDQTLVMPVLRDKKGRVLLEKRPGAGIWGGLWCLPAGEGLDVVAARLGVALDDAAPLPPIQHRLSHVRMTIQPHLAAAAPSSQVRCNQHLGWFDAGQQAALGLPKPVRDLLQQLNNGELK